MVHAAANMNDEVESTRELILRTATRHFAENGFAGASLREIGEDAGINFQSIRYHFGSKEALWESVVESLSHKAVEVGRHQEQVIAVLPLKEQLLAQITALVSYTVENPELWIILTRESMKNSERYRNIYPRYVKQLYQLTEKFLSKLQKAGVINNSIPIKDLVMIFMGALNYRMFTPADAEFYLGKPKSSAETVKRHSQALFQLMSNAGEAT